MSETSNQDQGSIDSEERKRDGGSAYRHGKQIQTLPPLEFKTREDAIKHLRQMNEYYGD